MTGKKREKENKKELEKRYRREEEKGEKWELGMGRQRGKDGERKNKDLLGTERERKIEKDKRE